MIIEFTTPHPCSLPDMLKFSGTRLCLGILKSVDFSPITLLFINQ